MNNSMILSDKELSSVCGGLTKGVRKTFSTIATVALAHMSVVELLKVNKDLSFSDEDWNDAKLERDNILNEIGENTHSDIVKKYKKGVYGYYNNCHNKVVDFLRSH